MEIHYIVDLYLKSINNILPYIRLPYRVKASSSMRSPLILLFVFAMNESSHILKHGEIQKRSAGCLYMHSL